MLKSTKDIIEDAKWWVLNLQFGSEYVPIVFRLIPWTEFRRINHAKVHNTIPKEELWTHIFTTYVDLGRIVGYDAIDELPAGIVMTTGEVIYELSNSHALPNEDGQINLYSFTRKLDYFRYMSSITIDKQMMRIICSVYKAYTFEMLEKFDFNRIMELFVAAEKHLLDIGVLNAPISFMPVRKEEVKEEIKPEPQHTPRLTEAEQMMLVAKRKAEQDKMLRR
jgi:hypothetical protein